MDSLRFLAQYDKEYRFLVATKINQDGVDCKRAKIGRETEKDAKLVLQSRNYKNCKNVHTAPPGLKR